MPISSHIVHAGLEVLTSLEAEQVTRCKPGKYPGTFNGADVSALMADHWRRGIRGAEIVSDFRDRWYVRSDTSMDGHSILASVEDCGNTGSKASAIEWAQRWASEDPTRRYVWERR